MRRSITRGPRLLGGVGMGLAALFVLQCDPRRGPASPPLAEERKAGAALSFDDRSRCEFRGRADREVADATAPGSSVVKVRKVYGLVGTRDDGQQRVVLCREIDTNLDGVMDVIRVYDANGEPVSEVADTNYDGKIDHWTTFARGRIAKLAIDHAGTGQPDETKFYVDGALSRVERDTNHDGKTDVWEIYDAGTLQRIGVDVDFDGHVDRWDRDEAVLREASERERQDAEAEQKNAAAVDLEDPKTRR